MYKRQGLERKLLDLGVEVHRQLNMTNRNLRYNERNLRAGISDYVRYDSCLLYTSRCV